MRCTVSRSTRKWGLLALLVTSPVLAIRNQGSTVSPINAGNGGLRAATACEIKRQELQRARADESIDRAEWRRLLADASRVCRGR